MTENCFDRLLREAEEFKRLKNQQKNAKGNGKLNGKAKAAKTPSKRMLELMDLENKSFWDGEAERKRRLAAQWQEEAVVLVVHEHTCKNCSTIYRTPNKYILLQVFHKDLGRHLKPFNSIPNWEDKINHLPHRIEVRSNQCDVCEACFKGVRDAIIPSKSLVIKEKETNGSSQVPNTETARTVHSTSIDTTSVQSAYH